MTHVAARLWNGPEALAVVLALGLASACAGDTGDKSTGAGDSGGAGAGGTDGADGADDSEPVEVGAFAIEGQLVGALTGEPVSQPLCIGLWDPSEVSRGGSPVLLWEGQADDSGGFRIDGVDRGTTLGLLLRSAACEGTDPVPTGVHLEVADWSGLGPGRDLTGVALPSLSLPERDALDAELLAAGAGTILADGGGILGAIIDPEWGPVEGGWVRGPDPSDEAWYAPWYDKGDGEWKSYDGSSAAGGARFVIPSAPWGAWICRASESDFPVLIGGGVDDLVVVHEFRPW